MADYIILFILFLLPGPKSWLKISNPDLVLFAQLGLLAFIALFYSLTFSDKSKLRLAKLKENIKKELEKREKEYIKLKNSTKDKDAVIKMTKRAKTDMQNINLLGYFIQLDKILWVCVMILMASTYSHIVLNNLAVSLALFLLGLTITFHIVTAWAFIFEKDYNLV